MKKDTPMRKILITIAWVVGIFLLSFTIVERLAIPLEVDGHDGRKI